MRFGLVRFPMRRSNSGKQSLRKAFENSVSGFSQSCRAWATQIITELRKKFALGSGTARSDARRFVHTVRWLAEQILACFEKFGEIFVTQRSGVTLHNLRLVSCAAEMISDGVGKRIRKHLFVRLPLERFNPFRYLSHRVAPDLFRGPRYA